MEDVVTKYLTLCTAYVSNSNRLVKTPSALFVQFVTIMTYLLLFLCITSHIFYPLTTQMIIIKSIHYTLFSSLSLSLG